MMMMARYERRRERRRNHTKRNVGLFIDILSSRSQSPSPSFQYLFPWEGHREFWWIQECSDSKLSSTAQLPTVPFVLSSTIKISSRHFHSKHWPQVARDPLQHFIAFFSGPVSAAHLAFSCCPTAVGSVERAYCSRPRQHQHQRTERTDKCRNTRKGT